nr:glycosyltransferase [Butyrivibrio sp. ob235]
MAHNEFHMLRKLLTELDDERNDIFLHIDKKTQFVDQNEITSWVHYSNVFFVKRRKVFWGTYSIVECELEMLAAAVKGNYHYYHLISGTDFPLKSQDFIHDYLEEEDSEFIDFHKEGDKGDLFLYKIKYYYPLLRYVGKGEFNGVGKRQDFLRFLKKQQWKLLECQKKIGIDRIKKYRNVSFYKGNQWFSITHDFAEYILSCKKMIKKMYRFSNGPDEIVVPTIALNSQYAGRVKKKSLRLIDWERGTPYSFINSDFDELTNSQAFFARKISYDEEPLLVNRLARKIHDNKKLEKKPLVSIVVPCYNVEEFLPKCVESLIGQTYINTEIILIDDGSTDRTGEIAKQFADEHNNIYYYHRGNGGLSAARNTGIDIAKGNYIAFVDSDDWVDCNYISKLYAAISDSDADISVCGYHKEEGESGIVSFDKTDVISPKRAMMILGDIYPKENVLLVIAWNKLYKTSLFSDLRYTEGRIHEDEFIAHRILGKADSIAVITDTLYHYRIREGSITATDNGQNIKHLDLLDAFNDRISYSKCMLYGDTLIYMLYTFVEGMKILMLKYSDEAIKNNKILDSFRSKSFEILFSNYAFLNKYLKIELLRSILKTKKYRDVVIRNNNEYELTEGK